MPYSTSMFSLCKDGVCGVAPADHELYSDITIHRAKVRTQGRVYLGAQPKEDLVIVVRDKHCSEVLTLLSLTLVWKLSNRS